MAGCLDLPLGTLPAVETWRADLLTLFQGAVLGWYACCCGDAWSRELGELSGDMPRLLTTLQPVRKGTHGAVTLLGLSGAAAGGLLVGLLFHCAAVLSPTLWVFEVQVRLLRVLLAVRLHLHASSRSGSSSCSNRCCVVRRWASVLLGCCIHRDYICCHGCAIWVGVVSCTMPGRCWPESGRECNGVDATVFLLQHVSPACCCLRAYASPQNH